MFLNFVKKGHEDCVRFSSLSEGKSLMKKKSYNNWFWKKRSIIVVNGEKRMRNPIWGGGIFFQTEGGHFVQSSIYQKFTICRKDIWTIFSVSLKAFSFFAVFTWTICNSKLIALYFYVIFFITKFGFMIISVLLTTKNYDMTVIFGFLYRYINFSMAVFSIYLHAFTEIFKNSDFFLYIWGT